MNKITGLLALVAVISSCNQSPKEHQDAQTNPSPSTEQDFATADSAGLFDIKQIPYSTAELGEFPFFTLPKGLEAMNTPLQKNFDRCFFPVNGHMTAFEGKLYKVNVAAVAGEEFSPLYFQKSLGDYLASIGAVKVYEGQITVAEYDRYHKQDANKGADGDIGYADEDITFYVIRTKNKGNVYVQYSANNASGGLLHRLKITKPLVSKTKNHTALINLISLILHVDF